MLSWGGIQIADAVLGNQPAYPGKSNIFSPPQQKGGNGCHEVVNGL